VTSQTTLYLRAPFVNTPGPHGLMRLPPPLPQRRLHLFLDDPREPATGVVNRVNNWCDAAYSPKAIGTVTLQATATPFDIAGLNTYWRTAATAASTSFGS
jgi:hypothetical protein